MRKGGERGIAPQFAVGGRKMGREENPIQASGIIFIWPKSDTAPPESSYLNF